MLYIKAKRFICITLTATMLAGNFNVTAFAKENTVTEDLNDGATEVLSTVETSAEDTQTLSTESDNATASSQQNETKQATSQKDDSDQSDNEISDTAGPDQLDAEINVTPQSDQSVSETIDEQTEINGSSSSYAVGDEFDDGGSHYIVLKEFTSDSHGQVELKSGYLNSKGYVDIRDSSTSSRMYFDIVKIDKSAIYGYGILKTTDYPLIISSMVTEADPDFIASGVFTYIENNSECTINLPSAPEDYQDSEGNPLVFWYLDGDESKTPITTLGKGKADIGFYEGAMLKDSCVWDYYCYVYQSDGTFNYVDLNGETPTDNISNTSIEISIGSKITINNIDYAINMPSDAITQFTNKNWGQITLEYKSILLDVAAKNVGAHAINGKYISSVRFESVVEGLDENALGTGLEDLCLVENETDTSLFLPTETGSHWENEEGETITTIKNGLAKKVTVAEAEESTEEKISGSLTVNKANFTYSLQGTTLYIEGRGALAAIAKDSCPWADYTVKKTVLSEGITSADFIYNSGTIFYPSTITSIKNGTVDADNLAGLKKLTVLEDIYFAGYELTIPENVAELYVGFLNAPNLLELTISGSVTDVYYKGGTEPGMLYYCPRIKKLTLNTEWINDMCWRKTPDSLEEIVFDDGCVNVNCFSLNYNDSKNSCNGALMVNLYGKGLKRLVFGKNVKTGAPLDYDEFDFSNLEYVENNTTYDMKLPTKYMWTDADGNIVSYVAKNGGIANRVDEEEITVGDLKYKLLSRSSGSDYAMVTGAVDGAISTGINIPKTITYNDKDYKVEVISVSAFEGRTDISGTVTIPDTVTIISESAFKGCTGLTGDITISANVERMGVGCFQGCTSLTGTLYYNSNSTEVSWYTYNTAMDGTIRFSGVSFSKCVVGEGVTTAPVLTDDENLTEVSFPSTLKTIQAAAYLRTGLISVTIPSSVTTIGEQAFYFCDNLEKIDNRSNCSVELYQASTYKDWYKNGNTSTAIITSIKKGVAMYVINPSKPMKTEITGKAYSIAINNGNALTYTGERLTPTVTLNHTSYYYHTSYTSAMDSSIYKVEYSNNLNAGKATVTVIGTGEYTGIRTATFTINPASFSASDIYIGDTDIRAASETKPEFTYTGKAIKPAITIKTTLNGSEVTLQEGVDYKLSYANNVKVKSYSVSEKTGKPVKYLPYVKVTGIGNFKAAGTITCYFNIVQASLSTDVTTTALTNLAYNKKGQTPVPKMYNATSNAALKKTTDYTILGYVAVDKDSAKTADEFTTEELSKKITGSGYYAIVCQGKGSYKDKTLSTVYVCQPTESLTEKLGVTIYGTSFNQTAADEAEGKGILPKTLVIKKGKQVIYDLAKSIDTGDVEISYSNNRAVGTATVTISAKEGNTLGLVGSMTKTYKISGKAISSAAIYNFTSSFVYDGTSKTQNFGSNIVADTKDYVYLAITAKDKAKTKTYLSYDATNPNATTNDYFVTYSAPKGANVGTCTMIITGNTARGYSGTLKKNFKIVAKSLAGKTVKKVTPLADGITISNVDESYSYINSNITPRPVITYTVSDETDYTLNCNEDYTISYSNNKKKGTAKIVIKGKGNYSGTYTKTFKIE